MRKFIWKASAASIALAGIWSMPALALQNADELTSESEAEANEAGSVGDIVVTAQKRSERLIDVPMSVSAISGDQLTESGIVSTIGLQQTTPGLVTVNTGFGFVPVIRGIQSTGTSPGDESNVAIYLDDISLGTPISGFFDLGDIERIEVLKGPQGTLFGRNATGGAIRIVTRKPSFKSEGKLSADYGLRYEELRLTGYVTGGLTDTIAASLSGTYRRGGAFIKGIGPNEGREYGDANNYVVRGKLLFEPSDSFSLVLAADKWRAHNDTAYISAIEGDINPYPGPGSLANFFYEYAGSTQPFVRIKGHGASADANWDLSDDISLRSLTGYRKVSLDSQSDTDRTNQAISALQIAQYQKNFSQEFNLVGGSDKSLSWMLGAFYYHSRASNPYFRTISGDALTGTVIANFTNLMDSEAYAGFGELTWNVSDRLHLTGGIRYNSETKDFTYRELVRPGGLALRNTDTKKSWDSFTYRAVARYDFADDANIYASLSTGFKSGVYNSYSFIDNPVDPEKVTAFEVGVKGRVGGITLTAAAFAYKYDDIQLSSYVTVDGQLLVTLSNAATAKMRGLEFTADGRLGGGFSFNTGFSWQPKSDYESYTGAQVVAPIAGSTGPVVAQVIVPYDASGTRTVRSPKLTANARLNYDTALLGGDFSGTINASYTSAFYWQPAQFSREDPYLIVNGRLSWTDASRGLTYSLYGNNLFDSVYHTDRVPNVRGGDSVKYPQRREFGVGIALSF